MGVAGAPVSLPWQKVDTMDGTSLVSVHKKGDWTILKSYIGVKVRCNSRHHLCEIILPGRMHGRSSGLLGCNDNEPANDLDLVDGTDNHEVCETLSRMFQVHAVGMTGHYCGSSTYITFFLYVNESSTAITSFGRDWS